MKSTGNNSIRLKRLALPLLLAGAFMVGACSGQTPTVAPTVQNTAVPPTEMPTVAPTLAPTDAPVATAEPATQPPAATLEATPGAGETAMPANLDELLVQSSDFIGMNIQGFGGLSLGTIRDVLVNETGAIQYIVVELPAISGGEPQNVIVDWQMLETVVNDAAQEDVQLNFNGTPTDLATALPFIMNEDFGAILTTTGTNLPEELNNLVSLAQLNTLSLQDTAAEELGTLSDALVDLRQGQVDYVVLDVTDAANAANTIIVPWDRLTIDPVEAMDAKAFVLDLGETTLENVPSIDLSQLPMFIDPEQVNWENIIDFWNNLG